jgi:hypothetical protein
VTLVRYNGGMTTVVLRVQLDPTDSGGGVVEQVRTGARERFSSYEMLVDVVCRMLADGTGTMAA